MKGNMSDINWNLMLNQKKVNKHNRRRRNMHKSLVACVTWGIFTCQFKWDNFLKWSILRWYVIANKRAYVTIFKCSSYETYF